MNMPSFAPKAAGFEENLRNNLHGVKRLRADGSVELTGGRYAALVEVTAVNTLKESQSSLNDLSRSLARAFDEELKTFAPNIYSTTQEPDLDAAIGEFRARVEDDEFRKNHDGRQLEMLQSLIEWYEEDDAPGWDARDVHHFAVVKVESKGSEEETRRVLDERVEDVEDALNTVPDITAERAPPEMHAVVLSEFWSDGDVNNIMRYYDDTEENGVTHAERDLCPEYFNASRDRVKINDKVAKTYWIAEYPSVPQSVFLEELYTLKGIDIDVNIHIDAVGKQAAKRWVTDEVGTIGAVSREKKEESELEAEDITEDKEHYRDFRDMLRDGTTQAWDVSMYVTVYADNSDALALAEERFENMENVEIAKQRSADEKQKKIKKMLTRSPAQTLPIMPRTRQREAFMSSSPFGDDEYDAVTDNNKKTRVPGGAIGAMFPFVGGKVQERNGFFWGRNSNNVSQFKPDPYKRASPHMTTMGQTRSGKTYSASLAAARWYAQSDDHQLIVADTQSGFKGVTELLGGEHIIIDGRNTINPFAIEAVSEQRREEVGREINPFGLKVDEVTQFFVGVLKAQGVRNIGDYTAIIEEAVVKTYNDGPEGGIHQNDLSTHSRPSPTIEDFINTLEGMLKSPGKTTYTDEKEEVQPRKENIGSLLNKLGAFKPGNKYDYLVGETDVSLLDDDVDMAYIDLQQAKGSDEVEKSMMLQLMLSQVSQKVKSSDKKIVFMIDEAHILLHSEEMVKWLQRSAREWARYDACMWFISQSPREFVQRSAGVAKGGENARRTILDQCSMIQFFHTPMDEDGEDENTLRQFGLNKAQQKFIKKEAVAGKDEKDYTECLVNLRDKRGWYQVRVESSPFEDKILSNAGEQEETI